MLPELTRTATAALAAGLLLAAPALASDDDPWPDLKEALFDQQPIEDGAGVISLEAPYRAHDAAIVPITINAEIPQSAERHITAITVVIDKNPAPVAAVFSLSPEAGDASISTRIRVNEYTNVRAIAETSDGKLYMVTKFVKAAGGCSAPAMKDQEAALARIGKMKLKQTKRAAAGEPNQLQLLISHPNYSGLQMDQLTRHFIPAHYVQEITVRRGEQTLLSVEGAISLSEDPSIHFNYVPDGPAEITVEALDTDGNVFTGNWPVAPDASS